MADGFCGQAQVIVGFSTKERAKNDDKITFIKWDLSGEKMSLTTEGVRLKDVCRQGLSSDGGTYSTPHISIIII